MTVTLPVTAGGVGDELVNLTYAYRIGDKSSGGAAANLAAYGINSLTKLGKSSSMKTMFFISSPQNDKAPAINHLSQGDAPQKTQEKAKSDEIIVQEGEFGLGSLKLKMGYQNVGEHFGGFAALQDTDAASSEVLSLLAKEKGLKRLDLGAELSLGHGMSLTASANEVSDKADDITNRSLGFSSGKLKLEFTTREVGAGFTRFKDIREADRDQLAKEAGIKRTNMRMSFGGDALNSDLQMLKISDGKGSIERRSASIAGRNYSLSIVDQTIDESFEKLGTLAPVEKGAFANERGMHRTNIAGGLKMSAGDLSMGYSRVTDNAGASILKQSLGFAGRNLNVHAKFWDIDQEARVADISDPEKNQMLQERGYKGMSLSSNYQFSQRMGLESFYYSAKNGSANLARKQLRNKLSYTTGFGAKVSLFRDQYSSEQLDGKTAGYLHQRITLEKAFDILGGLGFNGLQDARTVVNADGTETTATVDEMHLESDKSRRTVTGVHRKLVDFGDGKIENTQSFNILSKLSRKMNLTSSLTTIDRGDDGMEKVRAYGMQWAVSSRLNFASELMDKDGSNTDVTAKRSYTLSGALADRFAMLKNVKLSASHSVEDKQGKLSTASDALKLEANLFRGNFAAEYSGSENAAGNKPLIRGFSFASDKEGNKKIQFDLTYKTRDLGPGDPFAVRNYNMNYKLSERTTLNCGYFSYREKPDNKIDPVGGTVLNLATMIRQFSVSANFKEDKNYANGSERDIYGISVSGKLSYGALVEFGYSLDALTSPGGDGSGQTFRVKYDHQVDADHFLTLTSEYKKINDTAPGDRKDIVARLDFRTLFH